MWNLKNDINELTKQKQTHRLFFFLTHRLIKKKLMAAKGES